MKSSLLSRGASYLGLANDMRKYRKADGECVVENARRHLVERMGRLRGLPQKLGQMLSMNSDEEQAEDFAPLQQNAQALPAETILQCLAGAWQQEPVDILEEFNEQGLAASLGQVHRCLLKNGQDVAVKVRYPGIEKAILTDLKALGWMSGVVGSLNRGFDMGDYRQEIRRDLLEEIDYEHEANQQLEFARCFKHAAWIVPEVDSRHSTDSVLVSQWVEGQSIEEASLWPETQRQCLAVRVLEGFLQQFFQLGWFHADPHPGNFAFIQQGYQPKIVLYDYGSMAKITSAQQDSLLALIVHAKSGQGDPLEAYVQLGFRSELIEPLRSKLSELSKILLEPFTTKSAYSIADWQQGERVSELLEDDRWNFRISARAELLFLMRSFHGLIYYMTKLQAGFGWYSTVEPYIKERRAAIDRLLHSSNSEPVVVETKASYLRIQVIEQGRQKVGLKFKADCVNRLSDLMGEELVERVTERGIDLAAILDQVKAEGYSSGPLFEIEELPPERGVKVWLE